MKRLFYALTLPGDGAASLAQSADRVGSILNPFWRLRWVKPENRHLTLHFLGDTDETKVSEYAALLGAWAAGCAPWAAVWGDFGVFGPRTSPRVIWRAPRWQGNPRLEYRRLQGQLKLLGHPVEEEWKPHVTLAYSAAPPGQRVSDLTTLVKPALVGENPPFHLGRAVLFESRLQAGGSVYLPLAEFPLGDSP